MRRFGEVGQLASSTGRLLPISQPWFHPLPSRAARFDGCVTWFGYVGSLPLHRSGLRRFHLLICPLLTSPLRSRRSLNVQPVSVASNFPRHKGDLPGKTQSLPRVDAGFIKHAPPADGGLCGHVPTRPERTTPRIRFLFVAPRFWIGLPPDRTSR